MRFVDLSLAIPFILVALTVLIVLGQSLTVIILLLILFSWGGFARQVRAETLSLRTLDYIALAKVAGAGRCSSSPSTSSGRYQHDNRGIHVAGGVTYID